MTHSAVGIRHARDTDLPALRQHLSEAGLPSVGLEAALGSALVVRDGDRVVGSAALEPHGGDALLRSVAVSAPLRGSGLGERLVRDAIELAAQRGHRRLYLLTETAADWFPRFGFRRIDRAELPPAIAASP